MMFYENRLVWDKSPESASAGAEVVSGSAEKDEAVDDGTKVDPEKSGQDITETQTAAAAAEAQDDAAAEVIAQQADDLNTSSGDGSGKEKPAETADALGMGDIMQEIEEKGIYKVAQEKFGAGPVFAGIISVLYFMYKDQLFADNGEGEAEQAALDETRNTLQQQYQVTVDGLITKGKLPKGIKVEETDPGLIGQVFGVKSFDQLEAYLDGKNVLTVPAGTSLFDYLDKLKSKKSQPVVVPSAITDEEPEAAASTSVVEASEVDPVADVSAPALAEVEPESTGSFKYAPPETVDLTSGATALFMLPSGDRVEIDRTVIRVNGKKFSVKSSGIPLWFNKVQPEGDGFRLFLRTEYKNPLTGNPMKSESAPLTGVAIVDFISYLVSQGTSSSFSKTVVPEPGVDGEAKDPVQFDFAAA